MNETSQDSGATNDSVQDNERRAILHVLDTGGDCGDRQRDGVPEDLPRSENLSAGQPEAPAAATEVSGDADWDGEASKTKGSVELGKPIDFSVVEKGLRELNSSISLDVPQRRQSDWNYLLSGGDAKANEAQRKGYSSVYYGERFLCAIDRGIIPEFKVWDVKEGFAEVPMSDFDKYEDARISYVEILPTYEHYSSALAKAQAHDDAYMLRGDGKVFWYKCVRPQKVLGSVQKLGWRHTFESILRSNINGITRDSLGAKFGVDMYKYPVGPPEEVSAE